MKWAINGDAEAAGTSSYNPRTARAYCEGRKANVDGELISANPFTVDRERENYDSWNFGWTAASVGETASQTYCAV